MTGTDHAPRRAFRLTLQLDADSRTDLADALRNMACDVEREQITMGVSGGPGSGSIYELLHDPEQTHGLYFAQIRALLKEKGYETR